MANFFDDQQEGSSPLGGIQSLFPPAPLHETHTTSEGGTSTPVATPEYKQAIGDVATTNAEQASALKAKGDNDAKVAEALKQEAADQLAEFDRMRAEKAAESARQADNIKAQADVLRKANQELRSAPAPALFHEGDGWKNVAKAVALAVAAFGDALAAKGAALGGRSSSQNSVQAIVNNQLEMEREKIKKLTDNQVMAKTGLNDALSARATALAEIDARGAEAMRRAQMLGDYMVKSAGPQAAAYQARLDALNLQQDMNKFRASSLAALHKTVTDRHATANIDRDPNAAKPGGTPQTFDSGGERFDVNPGETTQRLHSTARAQLGLIQGAIENGDKVLSAVPDKAPTNFGYFTGDTKRADINASVSSLRNAAASALKESMGEQAGKERAANIFPDLPLTDAGMPAWRAKIKAGVDTMKTLKSEALHAAGAHYAGHVQDTTKPPGPANTNKSSATPGGKAQINDLLKAAGY